MTVRIDPAILEMQELLTDWRHDLHAHPETAFEENRTAAFVAAELRTAGLEVHEGIGGTGVVGVLRAGAGPVIGLRADMDALHIQEGTGLDYASTVPGKMHACGHDGHTTMLLGAARHLAAHPPENGTVVFVFQPAEENEGGARVMIEDGLLERFPLDRVFALHNWPGLAAGVLAVRPGPMMAALDTFELVVAGRGGHAAMPQETVDPIAVSTQVQTSWQTIVSRGVTPTDAAVISVTQIHAGDTWNVIPDQVLLRGTTRSHDPRVQDLIEEEMERRARLVAAACGAETAFHYERRYPSVINDPGAAELVAAAARTVIGDERVYTSLAPSMASEDFAFISRAVPAAYAWIGNGGADGGRNLHSPRYDFNDAILPVGVAVFCAIAKGAITAPLI